MFTRLLQLALLESSLQTNKCASYYHFQRQLQQRAKEKERKKKQEVLALRASISMCAFLKKEIQKVPTERTKEVNRAERRTQKKIAQVRFAGRGSRALHPRGVWVPDPEPDFGDGQEAFGPLRAPSPGCRSRSGFPLLLSVLGFPYPPLSSLSPDASVTYTPAPVWSLRSAHFLPSPREPRALLAPYISYSVSFAVTPHFYTPLIRALEL